MKDDFPCTATCQDRYIDQRSWCENCRKAKAARQRGDSLVSPAPQLKPLPKEWAESVNSARSLCISEANRWRGHSDKTADHWDRVAVHLGALYLGTELIGTSEVVSPAPEPSKAPIHLDPDCEVVRIWSGCTGSV